MMQVEQATLSFQTKTFGDDVRRTAVDVAVPQVKAYLTRNVDDSLSQAEVRLHEQLVLLKSGVGSPWPDRLLFLCCPSLR